MNDESLLRLRVVVERAVRPVVATMGRKRKIREELLAHLSSVFDEEIAQSGDQQQALDQATRRFGEPRALSRLLQRAVPWWDRWYSYFEQSSYFRPGETLLHFFAKSATGALITVAAVLPIGIFLKVWLVPGALLQLTRSPGGTWVSIAWAVGIAVMLGFLAALMFDRTARAIHGKELTRQFHIGMLYALAWMPVYAAVIFLSLAPIRGTAWSLHMALACAPCITAFLTLCAPRHARKIHDEEQWTGLRINE